MIALIQRVSWAKVHVGERLIGAIEQGLLAFIGVVKGDDASNGARLAQRLLAYRVFADDEGRMNRSLADIGAGLLLVPQFTLAADTRSGNRPGFSTAAEPERARILFNALVEETRLRHARVAAGQFGEHMRVSLINDGPVTFWLESGPPLYPDPRV
jgi:D-tyrosyl-tRNA(Tyr) deacylase